MNATEDKTSAAERPSRLGDVMMVLTALGLAGILAMVTWWPDSQEAPIAGWNPKMTEGVTIDEQDGVPLRPKTDSDIQKYKEWRKANRRGVVNLRSVGRGLGRGSEPPIAYAYLKGLFEHLNRSSGSSAPCDHTLSRTRQYLRLLGVQVEPMLTWLSNNDARCDCEVIFNTSAQWAERVGYVPEDEDE